MTYKIKVIDNVFGKETVLINPQGGQFTENQDNRDYQAYLKWLEEGNTPEPAENQGAQ